MSCSSYNCELDIRDRQIMICTFNKGPESVCMGCENKIKEYCDANGGSMTLEDYEKLNENDIFSKVKEAQKRE